MNYYRECVRRQICFNGGNRIHLSKNPLFCGRVESLIEAFPDARFVLLYRNPYETIPSLLKLMKVSWKMRHFDEERIRKSLAALAATSYHTYTWPLAVLARHPGTRFSVVDYRALVSAPEDTVRQVYSDIGLGLSEEFGERLAQEQGKAREHETAHRYSLEEFGLDSEEIFTELEELFLRFGWQRPVEKTVEGVGTA